MPVGRAGAEVRIWNKTGVDLWHLPANWNPNAVPTANDSAEITNGGTAELRQGGVAGGGVAIGLASGNSGTLKVLSGGQLSAALVYVGLAGTGTLEIRDGGKVTSGNAIIASQIGSVSTATVDGGASQWTNSGTLTAGQFGDGTLNVRAGTVSANNVVIGEVGGSKGKISLDGAATLTTMGLTVVGKDGNGMLEIKGNSRIQPAEGHTSTARAVIGQSTGTGTVTVDGSRWYNPASDGLAVIRGSLNIKARGGVQAHKVLIGKTSNSLPNASVTVEGEGSFLESSTAIASDGTSIDVGGAGTGTLTVKDKAAAIGDVLNVAQNGTVDVTGATIVLTNYPFEAYSILATMVNGLYVGTNNALGRLEIGDGGKVNSSGVLARVNGPQGTAAIVNAAGSEWNTGALTVGQDAYGELQIRGGGRVSASGNTVSLGVDEGSTGVVQVDGSTGSNHSNLSSSSLIVGGAGTGRLDITRGADVFSNTAVVGRLPSLPGDGRVTVDGSGSSWNVTERLVVGDSGAGTLNITGGADVNLRKEGEPGQADPPAHLDIGRNPQGLSPFARGTVTVDGDGSYLFVSGNLTVGLRGTGELQIKNGGEVESLYGFMGIEAGSSGSVVVDDGFWHVGNLVVGFEGSALLDVRQNGAVVLGLGGHGLLGPHGRLVGNGLLTTTTELLLNGVLAPGLFVQAGAGGGSDDHGGGANSLPGTLRIQGNYTQSNTGKLEIDLASPTNYDVLQVSGAAALNGTLEIKLLDGFVPSPSQTFNFLTSGSRSGQFQNVVVTSSDGSGGSFTVTPTPTGLALSNFQATPGAGGLVAHWDAENGAADVTGNGHDGIFRGNAATTTDGPFGKAFTLDGDGDYIEIGDELDMGTSDFTLSAWVKGRDPGMNEWGRILDKGYASGYELGRTGFAHTVGFTFLNSDPSFTSTSDVIDETWHHIAVVKSGTTATVYADGVAEGTVTVSSGMQDNALPLLIGYNPGEGLRGAWMGLLDELRIYDRALGASEIAELASIPDDSLPGDFNERWQGGRGRLRGVAQERPVSVGVQHLEGQFRPNDRQ